MSHKQFTVYNIIMYLQRGQFPRLLVLYSKTRVSCFRQQRTHILVLIHSVCVFSQTGDGERCLWLSEAQLQRSR